MVNEALTTRLPNQIYYFEIGAGRWIGTFEFKITDGSAFKRAPVRGVFRLLGHLLEWVQRLVGPAKILSEIYPHPDEGESGVSRSRVWIRKFGVTLYAMSGIYVLGPNGCDVEITLRERFGPIPWPFWRTKHATAKITPDGMGSAYTMTLLQDQWAGRYTVWPSRMIVRAVYTSTWGWARETIRKATSRAAREDGFTVSAPVAHVAYRPAWSRLTPFEDRLGAMKAEFERERDSRAVFTCAYEIMTRVIKEEFDARDYQDPAWVLNLAEGFLARYVGVAENPGGASKAWQYVFQYICDHRTSVLDDMMLPMTAHLVHDLPLALQDVQFSKPNWTARIADYQKVNDLLEIAIDEIQRELSRRYNPALYWLDALGKNFDETLTNYGVRLARSAAWYNACRLEDPISAPAAERAIQESVREAVLAARRSILAWIIRAITGRLRRWPRSE